VETFSIAFLKSSEVAAAFTTLEQGDAMKILLDCGAGAQ